MAHIPLFYRIFFLYVDPLICLSGIYLSFFSPLTFISSGVPSILSSQTPADSPPTPLTAYLLRSLGSHSLFVFTMQILLLHQFKDAPGNLNLKIWRIVQFGILLIDLSLFYGIYVADPRAALDVGAWEAGDWTNNGILGFVILVRTAFLAGVGGVRVAL
jgi:hypothetical protein